MEKRLRWHQGYRSPSRRVDESYVKVGGEWKYLCRAVDKHGHLIDFILSDRRSNGAAHRFLGKAAKTMKSADATIKGFEIMRMIRRGHCILREPGATNEIRFINKLFASPLDWDAHKGRNPTQVS